MVWREREGWLVGWGWFGGGGGGVGGWGLWGLDEAAHVGHVEFFGFLDLDLEELDIVVARFVAVHFVELLLSSLHQ